MSELRLTSLQGSGFVFRFRVREQLVLRRFRFRQAQENEDGAIERPHFFGGQ